MTNILLINLREWFVKTFKKKILLIEIDNLLITNKLIIYLLNLIYSIFFVKYILKYFEINIVYELDGLIFYEDYKKHELTINQVMLGFTIINPNNENNIIDKISKYSKNVPFYIIVKLENIDIYSNLKITLMNRGKIKTNEYEIRKILNTKLYELIT
jgi:hypothetical protein